MQEKHIIFNSFDQIPAEEQHLIKQAELASQNAYAPYSKFHVGAALLLNDGNILLGANQENAAYPSGLCAERVAIFNCMTSFPNLKIEKIAVIARKENQGEFVSAAPCGACRQVMLEQESKQGQPIQVIFKNGTGWIKINTSSTLLPFSFDKNVLI